MAIRRAEAVRCGAELTRRVSRLQNLVETVTAVLAETDAMQSAGQEYTELLRIVRFDCPVPATGRVFPEFTAANDMLL